jgi:hypothetical protein
MKKRSMCVPHVLDLFDINVQPSSTSNSKKCDELKAVVEFAAEVVDFAGFMQRI